MADRAELGRFYQYARLSVSGAAASYNIPKLTASPVTAHIIRLVAPSANTDVIRVSQTGVASATDLPIAPGTSQDLPNDKDTISLLSGSGTQTLDVVAFYR